MNRVLKIYDPALFLLACLATAMGLFFIFDAGYARSLGTGKGVLPLEFRSQLMFLPMALGAGWAVSLSNPRFLRRIAKPIWIVSLLLLVLVKFRGIEMNGAQRWLKVFGPIVIQPAEFAKLATVLYLGAVFAERPRWPKAIKPRKDLFHWLDTIFSPKLLRALPAVWILIAVYLIEKEPDLGTAAVIAATAFAMLVVGGVSKKSIFAAVLVGVVGIGYLIKQEPYRVERIVNHAQRWDPKNVDDSGFQTIQSELAQASGGVLGVGIGAGRAKHVLPATTTDFIMATIGEEFGLWGAVLTLGMLGAVVWRLFVLAQRVTERFSMLVLYGVASWLGIQACVNVMMANGFLPAIGIPLPFVSSGGSSLIALWMAIGACQACLAPIPKPLANKAVVQPPTVERGEPVRA